MKHGNRAELNTKIASTDLNTQTLHKFLYGNKSYQKTFDKNLKKKIANTYKFPKHDINKFTLLLQEVV